MKIYNRSGEQYIAYNANELISMQLFGCRFGSDGELYKKDNESGGDNKWYKIIIKTQDGVKSLGIDEENPFNIVP